MASCVPPFLGSNYPSMTGPAIHATFKPKTGGITSSRSIHARSRFRILIHKPPSRTCTSTLPILWRQVRHRTSARHIYCSSDRARWCERHCRRRSLRSRLPRCRLPRCRLAHPGFSGRRRGRGHSMSDRRCRALQPRRPRGLSRGSLFQLVGVSQSEASQGTGAKQP